MLFRGYICLSAGLALAIFKLAVPAHAVDVLTQHNDNFRSGANTHERVLTAANVNVGQFGKLFTRSVDGCIYAQPLVATGVKIGGRRHDVVYVATEHNSVYAFDAVDPAASTPLWQVNLGPSISTHDYDGGPYGEYRDFSLEVGITGTPVIDRSTGTLYVVSKTKDPVPPTESVKADSVYHLRLHALDVATGHERPNSPVEVTASMAATGDGSVNGTLTLGSFKQLNRPGLLLQGGVVYVALGALEDYAPYHGWVIGYDAKSLKQTDVFNATPDGVNGGIWASGNGPCIDSAGDIWVTTGNGTFTAAAGGRDYGDSFIRLDPRKHLAVVDWMTPHDQQEMDANDADLGSGGPVYVPGADVIIGGGKDTFLFVLDPSHAGNFSPQQDTSLQSFRVSDAHVHGAPVYWNGPTGLHLYLWPEQTNLLSFKIVGRKVGEKPESMSAVRVPDGMPGGFLSVSSDGPKAGTGIVWAMHSFQGDALHETQPGIVDAFDASDVSHELWSSKQFADRDDVGTFAKHSSLTVANGRVYVPTFSGQLVVYGLLPKGAKAAPLNTPTPQQSDTQYPPPKSPESFLAPFDRH